MAQFFEKGDPVPVDWYAAANLHPFVFGVPVMVEMVGGRRRIVPTRPMTEDEVVMRSDGALDHKQDSPVKTDPPWDIITDPDLELPINPDK